ncbi:MAG: DUF4330 family protein [Bacteroidota bacterium]
MKKYFLIDKNNLQDGPFDLDELKSKEIKRETAVWFEGLLDWTKAGEVDELKSLFVIAPPPIPKATPPPIPNKETLSPPIPDEKRTEISNPPPIVQKKKSKSNVITFLVIGVVILALAIGGYFITKQQEDKTALEEIQKKHYEETTGNYSSESVQQNQQILQQQENIKKQQDYEAQQKAQEIQNVKNNLKKNLTATADGDYYYRNIGGIYDCYVTLSNRTDYKMNSVTVLVSYLNPSGYSVENSYHTFYNVEGNTSRREKVDDSKRGTTVSISIYSVKCPALGL